MSDDAAPEGEASPAPKPAKPPKPKGSKLVGILLLANLGGTGFLVYETLQAANAAAAVEAAAEAARPRSPEEKAKEELKAKEVGPVTPLDPFIVNLNETDATRYLKATLEVEVSSATVVAELEKLKRPVRDELLRYLSSLSVADTQGEIGKAKIQQEVVSRLNRLLGKGDKGDKVRRLFFVEFMVQ